MRGIAPIRSGAFPLPDAVGFVEHDLQAVGELVVTLKAGGLDLINGDLAGLGAGRGPLDELALVHVGWSLVPVDPID